MAKLFWTSRWNLLRLTLAAFLLWAVAIDTGPRLARLALSQLPGYDYAAEVARLRDAGRFGEAIMVADAGLEDDEQARDTTRRAELERERADTVAAQSSWLRRLKDVGWGALTGTGGPTGGSLERLAGAVAADMLVFGDVRDLLIQGAKFAIDGEADPVIVALSGIGIVLTVAPEIDWAPSLLKIARKTGSMGRGLGDAVASAAKGRNARAIEALVTDAGKLGTSLSPGGALRVMRYIDDPATLKRVAAFTGRAGGEGRAAAFALHVTGPDGVRAIANAADDALPAIEKTLVAAARKGDAGRGWLRGGAAIALRPHPLLGLAKGVYKGNVAALAARAAQWLDPRAWWVLPLLATWVFVECSLLGRRVIWQVRERSRAGQKQ